MADQEFATSDDLGEDTTWHPLTLPSIGKRVRVRILETPEMTRLQFLPDLLGFSTMIAKIQVDPQTDEVTTADLIAENEKYEAHVVHLAVMASDDDTPVQCDACGLVHPPSLWTPRQAARLQPADLKAVSTKALGAHRLGTVRPFFTGGTSGDSEQPANIGESTPPTS